MIYVCKPLQVMMNDHLKKDTLIRLSTLAEKTGISVHCIRTYVDQGLIQVNDRTTGGLLLFSKPAIERLRFIRTACCGGPISANSSFIGSR